jgi:hypothetical protein
LPDQPRLEIAGVTVACVDLVALAGSVNERAVPRDRR